MVHPRHKSFKYSFMYHKCCTTKNIWKEGAPPEQIFKIENFHRWGSPKYKAISFLLLHIIAFWFVFDACVLQTLLDTCIKHKRKCGNIFHKFYPKCLSICEFPQIMICGIFFHLKKNDKWSLLEVLYHKSLFDMQIYNMIIPTGIYKVYCCCC